ncbi:MAG TPA: hypothetical protein ENL04_01680 [Sulfuricurvum sp.]|nr:hypothetical protein [Sulfuricurvum sp.]
MQLALLSHIWRRNKMALLRALFFFGALMVSVLILNDFIALASSGVALMLIALKWVLVLGLLAGGVRSLMRVRLHERVPKPEAFRPPEPKREHILSRARLKSRSERIMEHYRSAR